MNYKPEGKHARRDGGKVPEELQHAPAAPDVLLVRISVPAIENKLRDSKSGRKKNKLD